MRDTDKLDARKADGGWTITLVMALIIVLSGIWLVANVATSLQTREWHARCEDHCRGFHVTHAGMSPRCWCDE